MKKRLACPLLCLLLCLACLVACQRTPPSAEAILSSLMEEADGSLPTGSVYLSRAEEGSNAYPSPSLLRAMYGETAEEILGLTEDYAIYLSSRAFPAELAVFRCYSASDADRIAALCLNRRDDLQVALRGTAWEARSDSVWVVGRGRFVVMGFAENGAELQKEALRLIG